MIYDELSEVYQYDGGWAFEDGVECYCTWCPCEHRPWSGAWDVLCGALIGVDPDWDPSVRAFNRMIADGIFPLRLADL